MMDRIDRLFYNAGEKIKNIARIFFIVEAIFVIIGGLALIIDELEFIFLVPIVWVVGILAAYIPALMVYGFGELVEGATRTPVVRIKTDPAPAAPGPACVPAPPAPGPASVPAPTVASAPAETPQSPAPAPKPAHPQSPAPAPKPVSHQPDSLASKLAFALKYSTDDGMLRYLRTIDDEAVKSILRGPESTVRDRIRQLLESLVL